MEVVGQRHHHLLLLLHHCRPIVHVLAVQRPFSFVHVSCHNTLNNTKNADSLSSYFHPSNYKHPLSFFPHRTEQQQNMQQHEWMAGWIFAMKFRFVFLKSEFEKFLICFWVEMTIMALRIKMPKIYVLLLPVVARGE